MKPHSLKSIKRFLIEKKKHQQKQTQEGIFENHVSIFHDVNTGDSIPDLCEARVESWLRIAGHCACVGSTC